MTAFSSTPAADADDGRIIVNFSVLQGDTVSVGTAFGSAINSFMRFPTPGVSQGVTISAATLRLRSLGYSTTGTFTVKGCKENDSSQITSLAEFNAKPLTTAAVTVTPGSTSVGDTVDIDVATIIQEIVSQAGFSGAIQLVMIQSSLNTTADFNDGSNIGGVPPTLLGDYTAGPSATVPDAPTLVSAVAGNQKVTLTWTAPADDGGASITAYHVYKDGVEFDADATSPFEVTGLTNGVAYDFTVTAENSEGESDPSNELSATPAAPPTGSVGSAFPMTMVPW